MATNTSSENQKPGEGSISAQLSALTSLAGSPPADTRKYLDAYLERVKNISDAATSENLAGLYEVCQYYKNAISSMLEGNEPGSETHELLARWPELVRAYLDMPTAPQARKELIAVLRHSAFSIPLTYSDIEMLMAMLDEQPVEAITIDLDGEPETGITIDLDEAANEETDIGQTEEITIDLEGEPEAAITIDLDEAVNEETDIGQAEEITIDLDGEPEEAITIDLDEAASEEISIDLGDDSEMPLPAKELVETLLKQLTVMQEPLDNVAGLGLAENADLTEKQAALDIYIDYLSRFAEAAKEIGFEGLHNIYNTVHQNLTALTNNKSALTEDLIATLQNLSIQTRDFLIAPYVRKNAEALIANLRDPSWLEPLSEEDSAALIKLTHDYQLPEETEEEEQPRRPLKAAAADVSLELPADVEEDLFEIMLEELPEQTEEFSQAVQNLIAGGTLEDVKVAQRMAHSLKGSGNTIGVKGIANLTHHLEDILIEFSNHDALPTRALSSTMMKVVDCLEMMGEALAGTGEPPEDAQEVLQEVLDWANQIDRDGLPQEDEQETQSVSIEIDTEETDTPKRPLKATAADVSLALPDDVDDELLEILLEELPEQTEQFSKAVQNLIAGGTLEDVKVAQRMAHSLKGSGNIIGVKGIANLTHHMEDILIVFTEHGALPTKAISQTMMKVVDCLEGMGEALASKKETPAEAQAVLQEVLDWANRIDREGLPEDADTATDLSPEPEDISASFAPLSASGPMQALSDSFAPLSASGPMQALSDTFEPLSASGSMQALSDSIAGMLPLPGRTKKNNKKAEDSANTMVRVPASLIDNLLRLAGEATIMTGQMSERVQQIIGQIKNLQGEFNRMHSLGAELERLIDIKDFSSGQAAGSADSEFDTLEMDQYNELHTSSRMLAETATDSQELGQIIKRELAALEEMIIDQDLLNRETQDAVMGVRMVPVKNIVSKLQRSVRQTARLTSKQVNLHITGEDTQMDGDILNDLADPLMHLLRNAVDHGIEATSQRLESGKQEEGNILLNFLREGNNILIRCRDDGGGINFEAIQNKAEQLGILQPGQQASKDDLKRILLLSNFTTRDEVTQTSGRGVGMDAVYSKIIEMGGSLALESETGVGTVFELRVPLTLITSHALLVRQGPTLLAFSDHGVLQILHAQDGVIEEEGDKIFYRIGEDRYPARFLETIMELPRDRRASDRSTRPVFLVQDEMGITAVLVGEVLESLSIVVKDFGAYVPNPVGVAGAAILGDGSVKPVIDLPDLLRHARIAHMPVAAVPERTEAPRPSRAMVMVVDDSRSARYILTKVVEQAGYIVRPAHDGLEAIKLLEARPADIVLSDMEMPRMNGIELAEHMRSSSQLSNIPVIMITSRSTQKHRQEAQEAGIKGYFTKPFDEEGLLKAVKDLLKEKQQ